MPGYAHQPGEGRENVAENRRQGPFPGIAEPAAEPAAQQAQQGVHHCHQGQDGNEQGGDIQGQPQPVQRP